MSKPGHHKPPQELDPTYLISISETSRHIQVPEQTDKLIRKALCGKDGYTIGAGQFGYKPVCKKCLKGQEDQSLHLIQGSGRYCNFTYSQREEVSL